MLSLTARPCRIGSSINTRAEMHGEESVAAIDIPLTEIMLDKAELNTLLQFDRAHDFLFETREGGKFIEPIFKLLRALRFKDKIEGVVLVLDLGSDNVLQLNDCKLSRITLEPKVGGLTAVSVQVQCVPELDSSVARLLEKLNAEVSVAINVQGYGAQQELPLAGEQPKPPFMPGAIMSGGATSPSQEGEAHADPDATNGMNADELAQFEQDAQRQVAAYNAKPGEVIDGRTSRGRRRRGQAEAH